MLNRKSFTFRFQNYSYKTQRKLIIIAFSLIPVTLLAVFSYLPIINMIQYSFTEWNGYSPTKEYVGLDNYKAIFTNPEYFRVFIVSLYYFVAVFIQMGLALYFATIISFDIRAQNFFKGILFFPYLLNGVAIGFMFLFFFRPEGTLDSFLGLIGLGEYTQMWLNNPSIINISLASTSVWRHMGFNFIIFLGAISSISKDVYEAAEIDGANRFQQFRFIILPNIKMIIQLNLILAVSGAISVFEIPYIMTGGANGSRTFVIQTIDLAFKHGRFGLASAMGIILLIIVVLVAVLQRSRLKKEV